MDFDTLKAKDRSYIVNTYARFDVGLQKGSGATCIDAAGKSYVDFGSGIGVNSLGYCDKGWVAAVTDQLKQLQHCSNLYYSEPDVRLAEKLCILTGYHQVFFGNSGAEANECAIKTARKRSFDKYGAGRHKIISLVNSFHGRTITTLSATGQDVFHQYFYPFTEGFDYAAANDFSDLQSKADDTVCAIMMELIQGEGGVMPLEQDFVDVVKLLCEQRDITLIVDEVQTGIGRTGHLLACEHYGLKPDLVTLAKGLGGGLPIGAVLMTEEYASVLGAGMHGTTFGGNPVVCAGGIEVLNRVADKHFLDEVTQKGKYIRQKLSEVSEVVGVDGIGLMLGIRLKSKKAADVAKACVANGLLILTAKEKLRMLPPLTITRQEMDTGLRILTDILSRETL